MHDRKDDVEDNTGYRPDKERPFCIFWQPLRPAA